MAVYFEHSIQPFPAASDSLVHSVAEWHGKFRLLAVASKNGRTDSDGTVSFYHDEGELVEETLVQRSAVVQCLQWHPEKKLLAVGWRSGELTLCNLHDGKVCEHSAGHHSPVTFLHWNGTGMRLVSADQAGLVVLWQVDGSGQLHPTPLLQQRLGAPPTHCTVLPTQEETTLLVAADGWLFFMTEDGELIQQQRLSKTPQNIFYSSKRNLLAAISRDMLLTVFTVSEAGVEDKISEAKLGGVNAALAITWAPEGVLATCSKEAVIRFWDCEGGENYILGLKGLADVSPEDVIISIAYSTERELLAAGTSMGRVVVWQRSRGIPADPVQQWEPSTILDMSLPVVKLKWAARQPLLAANLENTIKILSATDIAFHFNQEVSAVQVKPHELLVESLTDPATAPLTIKSNIQIRGVAVSKEHAAVWDGRMVSVFAISHTKSLARPAGSFKCEGRVLALYEQSIITVQDGKLMVINFTGHTKHAVPLGELEGEVVSIQVAGSFLAVASSNGFVQLYDLKKREPRLLSSKAVPGLIPGFTRLHSAEPNSSGSHVSLLLTTDRSPSAMLAVWSLDKDTMRLLDLQKLAASHGKEKPLAAHSLCVPPDLPQETVKEQLRLAGCLLEEGLSPICHHWDPKHPSLLLFEATVSTSRRTTIISQAESVVVSMFLMQDGYALLHSIHPLEGTQSRFIGSRVPHLLVTSKAGARNASFPSAISHVTMNGFEGLEESDDSTIKAMLNFSLYSCAGNMDEAFRAIRSIRNPSVWENMARMCVRTQRLDVALVCLGNMGSAKAARAVRLSQSIPEKEARLAVLAVQLGMLDDAERLYLKSGRHDLLNKFYQACGNWQKAVEVAELHDRMHLKTTYYNLAKSSEALGEVQAAINSYEQSDTHQFEVPRMLLDDALELENYVMRSKDKEVHRWWAEYLESVGDTDAALQHYEMAEDYFSMVRVLYYSGNPKRALEVVEETKNRRGAYHLARQLSQETEMASIRRAIQLFRMAQCYAPAIQLAKEHGFEGELMGLALVGSQEDKLEAAQFYEGNPDTQDKAILLYHRGGELSKALELCFQHRQFDVLQQIAEELDEAASPEVISMVASYFIEHQQYDKAVELLMRTGQLGEALEICVAHSVPITEEMAESLTPIKKPDETAAATEQRLELLEKLADCCVSQGSYHLATKKYTQAGNKVKAMQALIKSGDTEKIVFFAGVSRQREIYVMAANYLQLLNWQEDVELMKNIITFYTKGKAMESLASFYDTCAQMEIDKYQQYDKAAGALTEALKCLSKSSPKNQAAIHDKVEFLKQRIALVKQFATARSEYADRPEVSVQLCQELIDNPRLDTAVRVGDVYALLIEHHTQAGSFKEALSLMEEMRQRIPGVNMAFYLDMATIEAVHKALAIPLGRGVGSDVEVSRNYEEEDAGSEASSVGEEVED